MTTETAGVRSGKEVAKIDEDKLGLRCLLSRDVYKQRFSEVLGERRGAQFISSLISVYNSNKALQRCDPKSVISAAAQAAALDLSIVPTIGQAAVVPYGEAAQFQIMKAGVVALAHRTNKYKKLNFATVYEGQLVKHDEFTGEVAFDASKKKSDLVEGFYFRFELLNGFVQEAYWSARKCVDHGWKYSKSFRLYGTGLWVDDPLIPGEVKDGKKKVNLKEFKGLLTDGSGTCAMAAKTVIKNTLSKWGPLSTDMIDAFTADQAVIRPDGKKDYIDTESSELTSDGKDPAEAPMPISTDGAPAPGQAAATTQPAKEAKTEPKAKAEPAAANVITFTVGSVGKTTIGDEPVTIIKTALDARKLYAAKDQYDWFKAAEKAGHVVRATVIEKGNVDWLTEIGLAPKAA